MVEVKRRVLGAIFLGLLSAEEHDEMSKSVVKGGANEELREGVEYWELGLQSDMIRTVGARLREGGKLMRSKGKESY